MRTCVLCGFAIAALLAARPATGGVVNPNISLIGQPVLTWTDDPAEPGALRPVLSAGETELVLDDYLNPYASGYVTLSLADGEIALEEGYFTIFRGLPFNTALKGGKYRVPFGRLNQAHPHTYPFAERFGVLEAYLPGDESYDETGIDLSRRFPIVGDFSVNAQADWFQGDTFRIAREPGDDPSDPLNTGAGDRNEEPRPAFLGRLSGFSMLGDRSALEFGASYTRGTNDVAARTRTGVFGVDAKAKLWRSENAYLVLQGELLKLEREDAGWDPGSGYTKTTTRPLGGYIFADYNFGIRYNLGASFERWQQPAAERPVVNSLGAFAGYALLEETTAIRLDVRTAKPEGGDRVNTLSLRVIFSMGPHKAHQF